MLLTLLQREYSIQCYTVHVRHILADGDSRSVKDQTQSSEQEVSFFIQSQSEHLRARSEKLLKLVPGSVSVYF